MTLRKKIPCIVAVICLIFIGVVDLISSRIFMAGFVKLEDRGVRRNVERVQDAIKENLANLVVCCGDYAQWDDTCVYIQNRNQAYVASNLVATTYTQQKINLIIIVNAKGEILFKKAMDWRNVQERPVPKELIQMIKQGSPLISFADATSELAGLVSLPDGIMLLASHPILTSEAQGPVRGAVIFARYLDEQEIQKLGKITHLNVSAASLNTKNLPKDVQSIKEKLAATGRIEVVPLDEKNIAGYTVLKDILGNPCLVLKVESPRSVYAQGLATQRYMILSLIVIAIIIAIFSVLLLEKIILHRLSRLSKQICGIGDRADLSARVSMEGNDELKTVALAVNEMLDSLEWSQHERLESKERYLAVVRQVSDALYLFDPQSMRLIEANPAFEKLLGYSADEIPNLTISDFSTFPPEQIQAGIRTVLESKSILISERVYRRKDGSMVDVEICANVISLPGKDIFCVVLRDISERKQAREALKHANEELERRVQRRTAQLDLTNQALRAEIFEHQKSADQLRKARDAAQAAAKAKSEFLANMSHEIRTPMNGILGMTDLVLETQLTGQQQEYLDVVKKSAESLMTILNDILEFSQIETGELTLKTVDFCLAESLDSAIRILALKAQSKDLELSCNIDTDVPDRLLGDPDHFRQIIMNIVGNAIKFTQAGYVRMSIEKISDDDQEVRLLFAVEDTGVGIPEEKEKQIFDPFSQADGSSTRKFGGTGMGLTISAKLIEMMGGKIWVESPIKNKPLNVGGDGSAFYFTLRFGHPRQISSQAGEHLLSLPSVNF